MSASQQFIRGDIEELVTMVTAVILSQSEIYHRKKSLRLLKEHVQLLSNR